MTMANASVPLFFQVAMAQTKKTRIGDILEVPTKKGLAYVQFSHEHKAPPCMGPIIRFLPGFHRERPKDLHEVANQKELYYTFFHAPLAVKLGQFQVAGNAAVPDFAKAFPLFRNGDINPSTGQYFDNCWLWDGTKSWKINEFSNEQLNLSIQSIWNDVLLKERIEEEWTPARDLELFSARRESIPKQKPLTSTGVNHFIICATYQLMGPRPV
jgi:hypothetical protein